MHSSDWNGVMQGEDSLYADNERKWTPIHRVFFTRLAETKGNITSYTEITNIRVFVPDGSLSEDNIRSNTTGSCIDEGMTMEFRLKMPAGIVNSSRYYKRHKSIIKKKIMNIHALDDLSDKEKEQKFDDYQAHLDMIGKEEEAEMAIIDEERNRFKDNFEWGIFRLPLDKQCQQAFKDILYCRGEEGKGDSVLIKCIVVKNDVYIAKTEASVYGNSLESPPSKAN